MNCLSIQRSTCVNVPPIFRGTGGGENSIFSINTRFYGTILRNVYAEKQRYRKRETDRPGHQSFPPIMVLCFSEIFQSDRISLRTTRSISAIYFSTYQNKAILIFDILVLQK